MTLELKGFDAVHQEVLNSSDLSKFQQMYMAFGIECRVIPQYDEEVFVGYQVTMMARTPGMNNHENDTVSDKIDGYGGFYVRHLFDQNGKFLNLGIWE